MDIPAMGRKRNRDFLVKCILLFAAAGVFTLLVNWLMLQDGKMDIGLQMNGIMLILFGTGVMLLMRGQWRTLDPVAFAVALAMLALALLMRMGLFSVVTPDYTAFHSKWLAAVQRYAGFDALAAEIGDYNAPYFYFVFLIGKLRPHHGLFYIKMFSVLFDLVAAGAVCGLVGMCTENRFARNAAFFGTLMLPTVVLNGACWGQCDAIYASLALLGLLLGLRRRSRLCFAFFALALAFKLQTVFLLPVMLVLLMCKRIRFRDIWVFFAAYFATLAPSLLAGRSLGNLLGIYIQQVESYDHLHLNATTFFTWFSDGGTPDLLQLQYLGLGLAFMGCLALLYYCYARRDRLDARAIMESAFLFCLIIPFFLPRMHERYFYCAELMALVYLALYPGRWLVPATVWLSGLFAYTAWLAGIAPPVSRAVMAVAVFLVICYTGYHFVRRVERLPDATGPTTC